MHAFASYMTVRTARNATVLSGHSGSRSDRNPASSRHFARTSSWASRIASEVGGW
jgi:hypothetical protein